MTRRMPAEGELRRKEVREESIAFHGSLALVALRLSTAASRGGLEAWIDLRSWGQFGVAALHVGTTGCKENTAGENEGTNNPSHIAFFLVRVNGWPTPQGQSQLK